MRGLVLVSLLAGLLGLPVTPQTPTSYAAPAVAARAPDSKVVSAVPGLTPAVLNGKVLALAQVGDVVVVGGTFSKARSPGARKVARHRLLAYNVATGMLVRGFKPRLNGAVHSAVPGRVPGTVLVGGAFDHLGGRRVGNVVALDVRTGAVVPGFSGPSFNGLVRSLALAGDRVLVGGAFTRAGGKSRKGLASLNARTGDVSGFLTVSLKGHHNDSGSGARGAVGARSIDVTAGGGRLVVVGNFARADGRPRAQVVMVDTTGARARVVRNWATKRFSPLCSDSYDSYVRDVAFSPDGSWLVVSTAGGGYPGTLCDAVSRFRTRAHGRALQPTWVDYSGGDSLWGVEATKSAVYVGGHLRWMNNSQGNNRAGPGAVGRAGIAALAPDTGLPLAWNPGRHPRGEAAYVLLAIDTGLVVGSDTEFIGHFRYRRPRLAYFPFAGGRTPRSERVATLPADVVVAAPKRRGVGSYARAVSRGGKGLTFAPPRAIGAGGLKWRDVRGAFWLGGSLYYGHRDGHLYRRAFEDGEIGPRVRLNPYRNAWAKIRTGSGRSTYRGKPPDLYRHMSQVTGFAYDRGRLYYTRSDSSKLLWRYFEPDSGILGSQTFVTARGRSWRGAQLGFFLRGRLYFASRSGQLRSIAVKNGNPRGRTSVVNRSRSWAGRALFLASRNAAPAARFTHTCAELSCSFDASASTSPGSEIVAHAWSFGDGSSASGALADHTYGAAGTYDVTLTVSAADGATTSTMQTLEAAAPDPNGTAATP